MMCGITGTPGTGKSMIGDELAHRGHTVIHLTDTVGPYVVSDDEQRDVQVIDVDRWAAEVAVMLNVAEVGTLVTWYSPFNVRPPTALAPENVTKSPMVAPWLGIVTRTLVEAFVVVNGLV